MFYPLFYPNCIYIILICLSFLGLLSSMDLVEVNPTLVHDPVEAERTLKMGVGLIASAMGNRIL